MKYKVEFACLSYLNVDINISFAYRNSNQASHALVLISPLQFSCEGSVEQKPHPLVASGREFSLIPACRVVHQPLDKTK